MSAALRRFRTLVVPCALGLLLAATLAGLCFALQLGLRRPSAAEQLAAQMVWRLERIGSTRAIEVVHGVGSVKSVCIAHQRLDRLRLSTGIRYTVVGTTAKVVGGREKRSPYAAAQADLAACPGLIEDELSGRLHTGPPVRLYSTRYSRVRTHCASTPSRLSYGCWFGAGRWHRSDWSSSASTCRASAGSWQ